MSEASEGNVLMQLSEAMAAAVEKGGASVVTVAARRRIAASGIAWTNDVVVTADHVIEDEEIGLGLPDGSRSAGKLAGRDPGSGVAVVRLEGGDLAQAVRRVASAPVGTFVLAVARPGEGGPVASSGVVSAVSGPGRGMRGGQVDAFLRTDAAFFPGFSGGALVDAAGELIGMNTTWGGRGMPMAIPVAGLARVVDVLLAKGRISRGYLGIGSQPVRIPAALAGKVAPGQETGLLIVGVEPESPADRAGLLVGDILLELAGTVLNDTGELQAALGADTVGRATDVRILRGGEPIDAVVTPGERQ